MGTLAVKICGVCTAEDASLATLAGADYVGVILVPGRSRSRTLEEAATVFAGTVLAGTSSRRVGVFVDPAPEEVAEAVERLNLDIVQLHGDESATRARELGIAAGRRRVRVWKAVRVRAAAEIQAAAAVYGGAVDGLLLEGLSEAGHGGVGARFDWEAAAMVRGALPAGLELVVAGGLRPDNVAEAVRLLGPDVVDVSSGVEESLCRKSAELVNAFVAAARSVAA